MDAARRERKRALRRDELIEAAFAFVEQHGLASLTVVKLAEATASAASSLYYYFPSKEALLVAMQRRAVVAFDERVQARLAAARTRPSLGSAVDALRDALIPTAEYLGANESREHQLMDAFLAAPGPVLDQPNAQEVERVVAPLLARCATLVDGAVTAGALDPGDSAERANALWISAFGLDHFRKRDRLVPEHLRSAAAARTIIGGLLVAWGARPEQAAKALADAGR